MDEAMKPTPIRHRQRCKICWALGVKVMAKVLLFSTMPHSQWSSVAGGTQKPPGGMGKLEKLWGNRGNPRGNPQIMSELHFLGRF